MVNPSVFGDPDHYSIRYTGPEDDGGVHINSGIPNQAFYLAVEGGRNRISGITVQGVGAANREQIERAFYRAFVFLLPASANFSTARAATIQAARDLYGANSAAAGRLRRRGPPWASIEETVHEAVCRDDPSPHAGRQRTRRCARRSSLSACSFR